MGWLAHAPAGDVLPTVRHALRLHNRNHSALIMRSRRNRWGDILTEWNNRADGKTIWFVALRSARRDMRLGYGIRQEPQKNTCQVAKQEMNLLPEHLKNRLYCETLVGEQWECMRAKVVGYTYDIYQANYSI